VVIIDNSITKNRISSISTSTDHHRRGDSGVTVATPLLRHSDSELIPKFYRRTKERFIYFSFNSFNADFFTNQLKFNIHTIFNFFLITNDNEPNGIEDATHNTLGR
jgi:hypothetical protein